MLYILVLGFANGNIQLIKPSDQIITPIVIAHIRHSRAGRALLRSRKECGRLWVLLGSAVQAGPHTQIGLCINYY